MNNKKWKNGYKIVSIINDKFYSSILLENGFEYEIGNSTKRPSDIDKFGPMCVFCKFENEGDLVRHIQLFPRPQDKSLQRPIDLLSASL